MCKEIENAGFVLHFFKSNSYNSQFINVNNYNSQFININNYIN
jgi:hypothetical protein